MKIFKFSFIFIIISLFSSCKEGQKTKMKGSRAENVFILNDSLGVPNLKGEKVYRKIWVYLPPNHNTSYDPFPVIYMHDGQNLFDKETSFAGEWGVDEILNNLFEKTGKGFIVVGIENVGEERINEYSPWKHEKYGGGNGDAYIDAIVKYLKPYIDMNYKTAFAAENTAIIGSSMGGLISYYAGLKYPDVFGKVGVISPSFWFSEEVLEYTKENAPSANNRMFFLLGGKEGMTKEFDSVSSVLLKSGFKEENFNKQLVPEGEHNEAFWNSQFEQVISWLYNINKDDRTTH